MFYLKTWFWTEKHYCWTDKRVFLPKNVILDRTNWFLNWKTWFWAEKRVFLPKNVILDRTTRFLDRKTWCLNRNAWFWTENHNYSGDLAPICGRSYIFIFPIVILPDIWLRFVAENNNLFVLFFPIYESSGSVMTRFSPERVTYQSPSLRYRQPGSTNVLTPNAVPAEPRGPPGRAPTPGAGGANARCTPPATEQLSACKNHGTTRNS